MQNFNRHDLVWLHETIELPQEAKVWEKHFPFVVTRQQDVPATHLSVAFCPTPEKSIAGRVRLIVPKNAIARHQPPIAFTDMIEHFQLFDLHPYAHAFSEFQINAKVYGSYAWQTITKKNYITLTSDLDLLLPIQTSHQLNALPSLLFKLEKALGKRLDGELIFPTDMAVSWREWFSNNTHEVLVKSTHALSIQTREKLQCLLLN